MANISKLIVVAGFCFGSISACATDGEPTAVVRQSGVTYCETDYDCNFGPGFFDGEHCTLEHKCRTIAEDPSCGLWTGTYPDCNFYDPCRVSHCAEGTECLGVPPYLCKLPGPGYNVCGPHYAYSDPCQSECFDDDDCEYAFACEYSPGGNVCG